jgi:hypothetical protein
MTEAFMDNAIMPDIQEDNPVLVEAGHADHSSLAVLFGGIPTFDTILPEANNFFAIDQDPSLTLITQQINQLQLYIDPFKERSAADNS